MLLQTCMIFTSLFFVATMEIGNGKCSISHIGLEQHEGDAKKYDRAMICNVVIAF